MKLNRLLGIGLVGKIARLTDRAAKSGSTYWPHGIMCWIGWNALDRWHYVAGVVDPDAMMNGLDSNLYLGSFDDLRSLIDGLTEDIAQARAEFPNIRYYRMFPLPSKEHKRVYVYEPNRVTEGWLLDSIRSERMFGTAFFIREEYVNGSWMRLKEEGDLANSLTSEDSKYVIEKAFPPFVCTAEIEKHPIARHVRYRLADSSGNQMYEGIIYAYDFDNLNDFYGAIQAEQREIESNGFTLSSADIDKLWDEIEDDEY